MSGDRCLHCGKYVFDEENVDKHKRMTIDEYISGVIKPKDNVSHNIHAANLGIKHGSMVNMDECELCGAPHAIFSEINHKFITIRFFYSGTDQPSQRDINFMDDFRQRMFSV